MDMQVIAAEVLRIVATATATNPVLVKLDTPLVHLIQNRVDLDILGLSLERDFHLKVGYVAGHGWKTPQDIVDYLTTYDPDAPLPKEPEGGRLLTIINRHGAGFTINRDDL
jgi:hypothetical protein